MLLLNYMFKQLILELESDLGSSLDGVVREVASSRWRRVEIMR
jgi:hypothetical protein